MEAQILRYYLSLFSFLLIFLYLIFLLFFKNINLDNDIINIEKGEPTLLIINKITNNENYFEKKFLNFIILITDKYYKPINYGKFLVKNNSNIIKILKIITSKSNYNYKITIVEGWEKYQLNKYLHTYYNEIDDIPYNQLIANTYLIDSSKSFNDFASFAHKYKKNFFKEYKNNKLIIKYGINKILILASLIEKEGKDKYDKSLISSVILNRLNKNMRLQIDASVIASITEGDYKLDRPLNIKDLKYKHPLNTYIIDGIPSKMICYVGEETIKILLENPKSDFLFYFYNILEKKHIFSKNFTEHRKRLNEYRKKIK